MDDNRDATDSGVAHRPEERNYDEERANLRHFFENIWEQDAKYLVFFTRKCFNLNQRFFLEALREETIGLVIRGRFLSQNALLALAPSLAEQYHEQGRFPSMLLADELASYGRAISSYMVALETSVFHAYQSLYGLPDNKAEWKLRTAFLDAIQIRVYMGHRQKLYLETRFQKRLKFEYPQTELFRSRSLMQWIPLWLRQEDVELTSYAPFFRLTLGEYKRFCVHMDQEEAMASPSVALSWLKVGYMPKNRALFVGGDSVASNIPLSCGKRRVRQSGSVEPFPRHFLFRSGQSLQGTCGNIESRDECV